jgi:octaprenyl-diphosphate synthase
MIDDALDYQADEDELGKSLGDDLAEGKPTLPLILALQTTTPENQQIIRAAIEQGDRDQFATIKAIIDETGSLQRTIDLARQEAAGAKNALNDLPDSEYKDALAMLADMAVERSA